MNVRRERSSTTENGVELDGAGYGDAIAAERP